MITPIIMLLLMTMPWLIALGFSRLTRRPCDLPSAAAIGLGCLFVFTGIGHFTHTEAMAQMLPQWVPARTLLVHLTGVLESAIAFGFFLPQSRRMTGWIAAIVLVLFFPVNIHAAIHHVSFGGHAWGPVYLLIRAPMQLIVLLWIYWFTLRKSASALQPHSDRPQSSKIMP